MVQITSDDEIVWNLNTGTQASAKCSKWVHTQDTMSFSITQETRSDFVFNPDLPRVAYNRVTYITGSSSLASCKRTRSKQLSRLDRPLMGLASTLIKLEEAYCVNGCLVQDIMSFQQNSTSVERLGYPTQKPRFLYERMIKASSKEDDIVLDPFLRLRHHD